MKGLGVGIVRAPRRRAGSMAGSVDGIGGGLENHGGIGGGEGVPEE